jgi:uncharacterized RDD family membrane protein YckC
MHLSHAASIGRRVAAAAIDGAIILGGFLAFTVAFVLTSYRWALRQPRDSHLMPLGLGLRMIVRQAGSQPGELLVAGALTLVCICLLYQALFFSFSGATPGMRCARIALCTFGEENPSRSAMRWRILALLLSACPLGLGFLWAALPHLPALLLGSGFVVQGSRGQQRVPLSLYPEPCTSNLAPRT